MNKTMIMDRRKEIRLPLQLPIECAGFDDATYLSFTHDISPNGLSMGTNGSFHRGSPCRVRISLPNRQERSQITGHVCWQSAMGPGSRVGIEFDEPIDFSIPFRAADQAVRTLQEKMDSHVGCLHQTLGDTFAWVNSEGEILECNERFLKLLGHSHEDVAGRPLSEFIHGDDQRRLSDILGDTQKTAPSPSAAQLFRIQPKDGRPMFWRIRVAPKSPWSTSRAIYVEDMTEAHVLKSRQHELEQTAATLQRAVAGRVIHLDTDLCIADIWDGEQPGRANKKPDFFKGMDLRKATALSETKVKGKRLWDQLKVCASTGREFAAERCHYPGRPDKTPDLFAPGALSISIKPIWDLDHNVTSLFMVVKSGEPVGAYHEKEAESLDRLEHILAAAAKGFLLKDVVKETCDPLTCLLARLDLLRHKLALKRQTWEARHAHDMPYYLGEIQELEGLVVTLSEHFKSILENTWPFQSSGVSPFDVNQTLLKTVGILESCGALDGCGVTLKPSSVIPMVEACEHEFIMIFVVFLLLSRACLKNVSDRAIKCETVANKKHIIARISHNGYIHSRKYLNVIFESDPLSHYFFSTDSVCAMDTLLYYAALLLKNNKIKTRITNIPGQFSLSLVTPIRPH